MLPPCICCVFSSGSFNPLSLAGSFDRFLNLQIALVIAMQLAMCLFCAIANYIWIQQVGATVD